MCPSANALGLVVPVFQIASLRMHHPDEAIAGRLPGRAWRAVCRKVPLVRQGPQPNSWGLLGTENRKETIATVGVSSGGLAAHTSALALKNSVMEA